EAVVSNPPSGHSFFPRCHLLCVDEERLRLQSHARAIRHSDNWPCSSMKRPPAVTIPRSGNPSFRLCGILIVTLPSISYNPTLGQSVIPTEEIQIRRP